jgi:hypothetical protein
VKRDLLNQPATSTPSTRKSPRATKVFFGASTAPVAHNASTGSANELAVPIDICVIVLILHGVLSVEQRGHNTIAEVSGAAPALLIACDGAAGRARERRRRGRRG